MAQLLQAAEHAQPGKASWGSQEATLPGFINPSEQSSREASTFSCTTANCSYQETLFQPPLGHSIFQSNYLIQRSLNTPYDGRGGFFLPSLSWGK